MTSPGTPTSVGHQLRGRREELDLTQRKLAQHIGIDASTVSLTEGDKTEIQRGKRPAWERALRLKAGTITRAYRHGSPIEVLPAEPEKPPYADMSNPKEAAVWAMDLPEADRRQIIDDVRAMQEQRRQRPA